MLRENQHLRLRSFLVCNKDSCDDGGKKSAVFRRVRALFSLLGTLPFLTERARERIDALRRDFYNTQEYSMLELKQFYRELMAEYREAMPDPRRDLPHLRIVASKDAVSPPEPKANAEEESPNSRERSLYASFRQEPHSRVVSHQLCKSVVENPAQRLAPKSLRLSCDRARLYRKGLLRQHRSEVVPADLSPVLRGYGLHKYQNASFVQPEPEVEEPARIPRTKSHFDVPKNAESLCDEPTKPQNKKQSENAGPAEGNRNRNDEIGQWDNKLAGDVYFDQFGLDFSLSKINFAPRRAPT